jgi:prepilin-type N-terminal cleavage/methylation domain-containing protein
MTWEERSRFVRQTGFTLLELLTVIAIIGILAGIVIGVGRRATESGKGSRARAELAVIGTALESYRRIYGDYPQTDDEARLLQSLIGKAAPKGEPMTGRVLLEMAKFAEAAPMAPTVPVDPFVNPGAVLLDPWGQPYVYVYKVPATGWANSSYVLYSIGPDGRDVPALLPGGLPDATPADNTDNLHANR